MKVEVTQKHIDSGVKNNTCLCPIALAIRDKNKGNAIVTSHEVETTSDSWTSDTLIVTRWLLPTKAMAFINKFDSNMSVEPFEFELIRNDYYSERFIKKCKYL